ncbi:MAG TPA: glycosyltransferase [Nannocystaceae bacterium]|nr:glycosyltransferase [Nannocystaceae bacterium]
MASSRAIGILGGYERDYPRNACIRRMLAELGYEVVECHSRAAFPRRHLELARAYRRVHRRLAAIWVAEGGHRLVPWVKALALRDRIPVIFDPFLSRYNTRVEDRRLVAPRSVGALVASWQDWSSCASADYLVFDTHEHRDYFFARYRLHRPSAVLEVAIDEDTFTAAGPVAPRRAGLDVLFYGTYIPLHGIDTILAAAARLRTHADISFTIVGAGQERARIEARLAELALPSVALVDPMAPARLAQRIRAADVCLGIFGATRKAANVVPNKLVQCAAMGKAIVTRRSDAVARYFAAGRDLTTVAPGCADALAAALLQLRDDAGLRARLGHGARAAFERSFATGVLRRRLGDLLVDAGAPPPSIAVRS